MFGTLELYFYGTPEELEKNILSGIRAFYKKYNCNHPCSYFGSVDEEDENSLVYDFYSILSRYDGLPCCLEKIYNTTKIPELKTEYYTWIYREATGAIQFIDMNESLEG